MKQSNLEIFFKNKKKIFIVGKGLSLNKIKLENSGAYDDETLIINLNDSETIIIGSIAIVNNKLTKKRISNKEINPSVSIYISDEKIDNCNSLLIKNDQINIEESGLLISQMQSDELFFFDKAILTALHLSMIFARKLNIQYEIFLLGIDLENYGEMANDSIDNSASESFEYSNKILNSQFKYLKLIIQNQKKFNVKIKHVGFSSFSWIDPKGFNSLFFSTEHKIKKNEYFQIKNDENDMLGIDYKVKIVAEITTNHFGDKDRLFSMIEIAAKSGADYVKFQRRSVDNFYSKEKLKISYDSPFGKTFRDYRLALELSDELFIEIDKFCKKLNVDWFLSVLDIDSFNSLKKINPRMIKLPSTISEHKKFLNHVANNYDGDLVISTGYTDVNYEKFILENFTNNKKIYMLHCLSTYPAPESEVNISVIKHYSELSKKYQNIIPGYSSHDIGSICSQLAVAAGAKMIEKHVKLGDVSWAHFDEVALDLTDNSFQNFVEDIRRVEKIMGSEEKKIQLSEHHKYWI